MKEKSMLGSENSFSTESPRSVKSISLNVWIRIPDVYSE